MSGGGQTQVAIWFMLVDRIFARLTKAMTATPTGQHKRSSSDGSLPAPAVKHDLSRLRVLLADDSPMNCLHVCAVLSQWGIAPDIACDGLQAARLASETNYDLVLMDLDMPEVDGFEATQHIRRIERARQSDSPVPVLAYSSQDIPNGDERLAHSGLDGVLEKPCDSKQMLDCLERWCSKRLQHGT